jgi:hypothetical protein
MTGLTSQMKTGFTLMAFCKPAPAAFIPITPLLIEQVLLTIILGFKEFIKLLY